MKKTKILMIDDNVELVDVVKEYFKDHADIDISLEAHDGEEGLKLIEKNQDDYDLILLDLIMTGKDGIDILKAMKKKND